MGWRRSLLRIQGARRIVDERVLICGGGPTGLCTALLLAKYGIPCVIFERSGELPKHPKAHCINHRTMEVFRGMMPPGLATRVCDAMPPLEQWRSFVYSSGALPLRGSSGSLLGKVDHFGSNSLDAHISPEPVAHLPQHQLIPILVDQTRTFGDLIDLRMDQQVIGVESQNDSVRVKIEGKGVETGSYLVAADGAHSGIRKSLGIDMDGPGTLQHLVNIHFTSPTLGRRLIDEDNMGMLYFIFGSKNIVVLVAHSLEKGEFVAQVPFFPPLQNADDFDITRCENIIKDMSGFDVLDLKVLNARPWAMGAAVATCYRHDNIFLAGDAAHIVPPAGAFGMNTGIQDAHNIAWKLAFILQGARDTIDVESVLQSYEAERKPVALTNMNVSVDNFHEALHVARIIGLDFDTAQSLNSVLNGPWSSWAPESVRKYMLTTAMSSGLLLGQALAATRRKELQELFTSGKTLRLQYPKEDVGFSYTGKNAYVHVEPELEDAVHEASLPKPRDAPYIPQCLPGHRLPHIELMVAYSSLDSIRNDTIISSLDVPDAGGLQFVVFIRHGTAAEWRHQLDANTFLLVCISSSEAIEEEQDDNLSARLIDTHGVFDSYLHRLKKFFGGLETPGILVRPDGHIAWIGPPSRISSALDTLLSPPH